MDFIVEVKVLLNLKVCVVLVIIVPMELRHQLQQMELLVVFVEEDM